MIDALGALPIDNTEIGAFLGLLRGGATSPAAGIGAAGLVILIFLIRRRPVPVTDNSALPRAARDSAWLRMILVFAMTLPMLVLYSVSTLGPSISQELGFQTKWMGYLILSSFGFASILSPWGGAYVNRVGARIALRVLFFAIATAFAMISVSQSFHALVLAAAICGVAQAIANPVTNLMIAQQVPPAKKAGVVGLKQAGVQIAALFAGLILPGIALRFGWRVAFGAVTPLAILFLWSVSHVTPRYHQAPGQGLKFAKPNGLLLRLMAIQFCVGISLSAFVTFLPAFATQQAMSMVLAAKLIAVFGAMGIISRIVLTPLGAKMKDESYLLLALIVLAALAMAVAMFAEPGSHWRLWFGAAGVGLTAVGANAIAMSMLIRDAGFGLLAIASGLVSVAFFGGFALGPPLYAALSSAAGIRVAWYGMIAVLVLGGSMALTLAAARREYWRARDSALELSELSNQIGQLTNRIAVLENEFAILHARVSDAAEQE